METGGTTTLQDGVGNQPKDIVYKLPDEPFRLISRFLSVRERIRCERVSPRWKQTFFDRAWTGQKKLNGKIIFAGAKPPVSGRRRLFGGDEINLLFHRVAKHLEVLDFDSITAAFNLCFDVTRPLPLQPLSLLLKLVTLKIRHYDLQNFVQLLPQTLEEIDFGRCDEASLNTLGAQCPGLKSIDFHGVRDDISIGCTSTINNFVGRYLGLRNLVLDFSASHPRVSRTAPLAAIGQLHGLQTLCLSRTGTAFNDATIRALVQGCRQLRSFHFSFPQWDEIPVSREALLDLAQLPKLVDLCVREINDSFAEDLIRALCPRAKLKIYPFGSDLDRRDEFMSLKPLLEHCKPLLGAHVCGCYGIQKIRGLLGQLERRLKYSYRMAAFWGLCYSGHVQAEVSFCGFKYHFPNLEPDKKMPENYLWMVIRERISSLNK